MRSCAVAVQLALAYATALDASTDSHDRHNALLAHFDTWEALAGHLGCFAVHVSTWADRRSFDNWYELVDALADSYLTRYLELVSNADHGDDYTRFDALVAHATEIEPPQEVSAPAKRPRSRTIEGGLH